MDDEQPDPKPASVSDARHADWVGASGVSGEHVLAGERPPRLHGLLMILGPIGLAVAIVLSLWSSGRRVERSVNVQIETTWEPGEQLAVRTQIVDGGLGPLAGETRVSLDVVDASGRGEALGELEQIGPGLAQGSFTVPALEPGEATLVIRFAPASERLEPVEERLPITVVGQRSIASGRQVISENILQWADDTDEQPPGIRVDLRPSGRLLAGFENELFVRVTDPAGKPWKPAAEGVPALIQVALVSGEFGGEIGRPEHAPVLVEGPVDAFGLARFTGRLSSDVVRFEIRLIDETAYAAALATAEAGAPAFIAGPRRRLRFVSHAGTVRILASTNFAHPGDRVELSVEAISARKPVFVDVHGSAGAWLDTFTPPLHAPQAQEWTIPASLAAPAPDSGVGALIQFEAYQSMLRPEDSSAIARVQIMPPGTAAKRSVASLIERQRQQLSLPRVDKQFEIGRERAYLSELEAGLAALPDGEEADATVERARAFLLGSLEAVVHGPAQALNTRAREDRELAAFKRRAVVGIRWFLLGGGGLFIFVMVAMVWRNQRKLERQTNDALGLVARGSGSAVELDRDDEAFADQAMSILSARRQVLARGVLTIGLMVAALLLTVAMLESLVWDY